MKTSWKIASPPSGVSLLLISVSAMVFDWGTLASGAVTAIVTLLIGNVSVAVALSQAANFA
jgi:hypothetical protein